ncbi:MAG: CRISPR-associated helicase Cas3' [Desulfobulbaceae bacterium]|nr:CRISPR-associated helicase Cas3' [Desulfobulbaceae bacterium]
MTPCFAHSENDNGEKHSLFKHLYQTSQFAENFACQENYKPAFKITGLLHDLGKYQSAFQDYLINGGRRGSVPHASWGAGYARIHKLLEASIAIDGHHKGLPDNAAWKSDTNPYMHNEIPAFKDVVLSFLDDVGVSEVDINTSGGINFSELSQREIFVRYLFSALTDSDWLSTEEHFEAEKSAMRVGCALPVDEMIIELEEEFSRKSTEGEINRLRNAARSEVVSKALLPLGFYSLALPTGMGKTLTSLAWALRHAKQNGLKRIIIVLPYINIIDQTAQTLKGIFGDEIVLEHHSSYNEGKKDGDDEKEALLQLQKRQQLSCENWDYPLIVTTTVQFFESLFSNRPSKCRKNHNISESLVIFDEVQSLPKEVILPTLQMLKDIQVVMKSSFLFCTATQPAFEKRPKFDGITAICPLIKEPDILYDKTRRVEYHLLDNLAPIEYGRLSAVVLGCDASTLVIFNTKKASLEFYTFMGTFGNWESKYHLSTSMCPSHRKNVIKKIRDDLSAKKKILVVSTQLIEAGVDFDFPVLFRAMAPLEAVIQSAGRCNREGKLAVYGKVFLFKLQNGGMPDKTYAACAGFAEELIKTDINQLYKHDVFERYYSQVIDLYVDPDKYAINDSRRKFNFATVNDSYRIIQKATEGLFICNFNEDSRQLLHSLRYKEFLGRNDYRKMQAYTVQVYEKFIFQHADLIETMPQGFRVWHGKYDQATGISVAPMEADNYVV